MSATFGYQSNSVASSTSLNPMRAVAGAGRVIGAGATGFLTGGPLGAGMGLGTQALSEAGSSLGGGAGTEPDMASMRAENSRLLMLQMEIGRETNRYAAASNIQKADHDARRQTIVNFK